MKTLLVLVFISLYLHAQDKSPYNNDTQFRTDKQLSVIDYQLSGSLYNDSKQVMADYVEPVHPVLLKTLPQKKSPFLAGLFSILVPGSGEFFVGGSTLNYIKGGFFVALEGAAILTAVQYDKKGNDKTTEFQNYADSKDESGKYRWSVVRYAEWIKANVPGAEGLYINPDENLLPWNRVNWAELNSFETGSHKLPPHGDQQYYELIGKYHQYSPGWNDFTGGSNNAIVSPNFLFYARMRGDANDFYNVASKAVIVIYINHLLSTLDAIWSAVSFNKDLAFDIKLDQMRYAVNRELIPVLNLKYTF